MNELEHDASAIILYNKNFHHYHYQDNNNLTNAYVY